METRVLKEKAELIFDYFDVPDNAPAGPFSELIEETFNDEWTRIEGILQESGIDDEVIQLVSGTGKVSFAMGFVMGKILDPDGRAFQEAEKAIEKIIRERRLFPYLPRERKVA